MINSLETTPTGDAIYSVIRGITALDIDKAQEAYTDEVDRLIGPELRRFGLNPADPRFRLAARGIREVSPSSIERFRGRFANLAVVSDDELGALLALIVERLRNSESAYHKVRLRCTYVEGLARIIHFGWLHRAYGDTEVPAFAPSEIEDLKAAKISSKEHLLAWARKMEFLFERIAVFQDSGKPGERPPVGLVRESSARIYIQYWRAFIEEHADRILEIASNFIKAGEPSSRMGIMNLIDPNYVMRIREKAQNKFDHGDMRGSIRPGSMSTRANSETVVLALYANGKSEAAATRTWNSRNSARVEASSWVLKTLTILPREIFKIQVQMFEASGSESYEWEFKSANEAANFAVKVLGGN